MENLKLKVVKIGSPDITLINEKEIKTFLEILLERITKLNQQEERNLSEENNAI